MYVCMKAVILLLRSLQLDFLQLESSLPATDPCYKYSQGRSQLAPVQLRKNQADLSQTLSPLSPEKEEEAVSDKIKRYNIYASMYVTSM